jgi:predicted dithiol-disulfide oxidoreductase (DUF899 family)
MPEQNGPLHDKRFPGESADYRAARDALLKEEIELRRRIEAVASARRTLPPGGEIEEDYVFEAQDGAVRLSELFGDHSALIAYGFMYGPDAERPCPSCTSIIDSLEGAAAHVGQRAALVAIARSPIARIQALRNERGWSKVRFVSSAANSFNRSYHSEDEAGNQWPILNVFARSGGTIRHSYATELLFAPSEPGQDARHVDSIWPLWNLLDFTPEGRGDFRPKLDYS